jgi:hypothetical protein
MGMTDDLQIRLATTDDLDEVMTLAFAACHENAFLNASKEKLVTEFWPALYPGTIPIPGADFSQLPDHGLCPVIGPPGGAIEGLVLLRMVKMWYSNDNVLEERGLFIYPQFRAARGGRAKRLVEYSKHVADQLKMPLIMGVLSNTRTEGKVRLYTRLFGNPAGAFFLHGATTIGHGVQ